MSACMYDDAPSVTICPECDFGVCQDCMDGGAEGVCRNCAEERANRRENSAVQRERVVEAAVRRCNYCRASEDDTTTLDKDGYCEACRALPRCVDHAELIAVGHCKSCRREFCRKCLGFTDICQSCAAKGATKRPTERSPSGTAVSKGGKAAPKKVKKTSPMDDATAKKASGPLKAGGKGKTKPLEGDGGGARPKKPSRGREAMEEKLKAKSPAAVRRNLIIGVSVVGLLIMGMIGSFTAKAMSPEEQNRRMAAQMKVVHRGVVHYYKRTGKMPRTADEIHRALNELNVKNASKVPIAVGVIQPGAIIYRTNSSGFQLNAADAKGQLIESTPGTPLMFDQYYDSSE